MKENDEFTTKMCTGCEIRLGVAEFYRNPDSPDGLRSRCKSCTNEQHRQYRQKNPEKIKEKSRREYLANRDSIRDRHRLWRENNRERQQEKNKEWVSNNRERWREYQKRYAKDNREKLVEYRKKYYRDNRDDLVEKDRRYRQTDSGMATSARRSSNRRSREKSVVNDLTAEQWKMIIRKQKNRCVGCGERFTKKLPPTRDHIIPVSKGGGLTVTNVVALCGPCNSAKNNKDAEYTAQRGLL